MKNILDLTFGVTFNVIARTLMPRHTLFVLFCMRGVEIVRKKTLFFKTYLCPVFEKSDIIYIIIRDTNMYKLYMIRTYTMVQSILIIQVQCINWTSPGGSNKTHSY